MPRLNSCSHGVPCNSWIVVRKDTGEAVREIYSDSLVAKLKPCFEALRPCVYLPKLNRLQVTP
jgi:hypothetical protein